MKEIKYDISNNNEKDFFFDNGVLAKGKYAEYLLKIKNNKNKLLLDQSNIDFDEIRRLVRTQ